MKLVARRAAFLGLLSLTLLGVAACGDEETYDKRGYTKAPLEDPGFTVEDEPDSPMDDIGTPNYPVVKEIPAPDSGAAKPAAS